MPALTQGVTNFLLNVPFTGTNDPSELSQNQDQMTFWANQTPFLTMFSVGTATAGVSPSTRQTPTQTFLVQGATVNVNFDANGNASITFPRKFPNGLIAVQAMATGSSGTQTVISLGLTATSTTSFSFEAVSSSPVGGVTSMANQANSPITWLAVGW